MSKLSETFSPDEQEKVLDKIDGFKQQIQLEMIKRSGGNVDKLEELREQAIEGAFNTHLCRSLEECQFIPEELMEPVKEAIKKFEEEGDTSSFRETLKKLKNSECKEPDCMPNKGERDREDFMSSTRTCTKCNGKDFVKSGTKLNTEGRWQVYQCMGCGHKQRGELLASFHSENMTENIKGGLENGTFTPRKSEITN